MRNIFITARMDDAMERFLQRVRYDAAQPPTRVYVGIGTFRACTPEDPRLAEQWLLIDSDQVDTDATRALAARLTATGSLIIAARFSHLVPIVRGTVPAKLRALQCHGRLLRLFHYADDQMDLLTSFFFGAADYQIARPKSDDDQNRPDQADPLLGPAEALAEAHGSVSLSLIQRTYAIGYSRAHALAATIRQRNEEQGCA